MARIAATSRVAKNAGNTKSQGTLLEGFGTVGDWTKTGTGATLAVSEGALAMTAAANNYCIATKTVVWDLSETSTFKLSFYCGDLADMQYLKIYMASDSAFSNMFSCQVNAAYDAFVSNEWNTITLTKSDFTAEAGSPGWGTIVRFRIRLQSTAAASGPITGLVDNLIINARSEPKVVISFDDSWASPYEQIYDYMVASGIPATLYIIGNTIDEENHLTTANLATIYAAGWDIGNHTWEHTNLTELTTQDAVNSAIKDCMDLLETNGFIRSFKHFSYPYGAYNSWSDAAMVKYGILTARSVRTTGGFMVADPPDSLYRMQLQNLGYTDTVAAIKLQVDKVCRRGGTLFLNGHKVVEGEAEDGTEYNVDNLKLIIDHIKQRQDEGLLEAQTISEWYAGLMS